MKPVLHLQTDLFWEEENNPDYLSTIQKYFNVQTIDKNQIWNNILHPVCFRGSLNMAKRYKLDYRFSDCMSWIPIFRKHILSPRNTFFNDLGYFANYSSAFDFPKYIRPADGFKSFAGQVFPSKEKFMEEYNYLTKNLNFSDDLMCVTAPIKKIDREWRTVFVDNKFVDGCLYMQGHDFVEVENKIPEYVVKFASDIARTDYFLNIYDFVIDICESNGSLFLLEINSFNSSSFYGCNLDKIYSAWAITINNNENL